MPTTLPGFLLVAGTLMVVLSLFGGPVEVKELKLPTINSVGRIALRVIGGIFLLLSAYIYYPYISGKTIANGDGMIKIKPGLPPYEPPRLK